MQIWYEGFPIGAPTRRITSTNVKFNQEVIDKLMNSEVIRIISAVSQLMEEKGLKAKLLAQNAQGQRDVTPVFDAEASPPPNIPNR